MFTSFLIPALTYGPELVSDAEAVFNSLAHGEGGVAKIETAFHSLIQLVEHAATAAVSAGVPGVTDRIGAAVANIAARTETDVNDIVAVVQANTQSGPASTQSGVNVVGDTVAGSAANGGTVTS